MATSPLPGRLPAPLAALLNETVTQSPFVGHDAYGKPTYGPDIIRPARVEYQTTVVSTAQAQERTSTTLLFLNGDLPISERDKVLLSDGTAPTIQKVKPVRDRFRPATISHYEIAL